jgi:hypothetical protein
VKRAHTAWLSPLNLIILLPKNSLERDEMLHKNKNKNNTTRSSEEFCRIKNTPRTLLWAFHTIATAHGENCLKLTSRFCINSRALASCRCVKVAIHAQSSRGYDDGVRSCLHKTSMNRTQLQSCSCYFGPKTLFNLPSRLQYYSGRHNNRIKFCFVALFSIVRLSLLSKRSSIVNRELYEIIGENTCETNETAQCLK